MLYISPEVMKRHVYNVWEGGKKNPELFKGLISKINRFQCSFE